MDAIFGPMSKTGLREDSPRADFPLLVESRAGRGLHYLDNAATTHKPAAVIDAVANCYRERYGPVNRGLYPLAETATEAYESARTSVAGFIGAQEARGVVFTRSATEALNLVAQGWARHRLRPGDDVWVTRMEHHANFLPWQRVCVQTGARLRIVELDDDGSLDLDTADGLFGARTRLIAVTHLSNVLGVLNPVEHIVAEARARGIAVVVDAAQSVAHAPVDFGALGCDFLAFSAHKMYGPTGIGVLAIRPDRLNEIEPLLVGGGMVDEVGDMLSSWGEMPDRLEAGSPDLAGAAGLAAAVDYLRQMDTERIRVQLDALTESTVEALRGLPDVEVYGPRAGAAGRMGIVSFNVTGIHPHDLAQIAGERGVAIRAGHHCCQPLMRHLGVPAVARASLGVYNTRDDIDALIDAIGAARGILGAGA